uniref:General transcription factor IIH subunit 3 n=1 Tax=Ciona intestinalis TaxID=7719 RepID=H2XVN4_CIOIN|nr:general transcription factor IIH subunit 3-like [Ciona intestinalis]|eukprot:XP_002120803.1 general transcription factor IIH subunit 3-like [Ciona intestinalis]
MANEEERQLLVVIFDVNPVWWGIKSLQGQAQITKCLDCLLVFVNSYLMLRHDNKLAIIASHSTKSVFLYPAQESSHSPDPSKASISDQAGGDCRYEHFAKVDDSVTDKFKELMRDGCEKNDIRRDSLIAGSMAIALCYIHRMQIESQGNTKLNARILVIKAADDAASQYMSFMNVIFAAQKERVVVDACILGQDSGLLQQACDMTSGMYLKVPHQDAFLQYLLTAFLTEAELRKESLVLAQSSRPREVDYRAACFCHRSLVDVGFVCSVCLSIFCQFSPICSTCETAFKPPVLASKSRKKRRALPANGT